MWCIGVTQPLLFKTAFSVGHVCVETIVLFKLDLNITYERSC